MTRKRSAIQGILLPFPLFVTSGENSPGFTTRTVVYTKTGESVEEACTKKGSFAPLRGGSRTFSPKGGKGKRKMNFPYLAHKEILMSPFSSFRPSPRAQAREKSGLVTASEKKRGNHAGCTEKKPPPPLRCVFAYRTRLPPSLLSAVRACGGRGRRGANEENKESTTPEHFASGAPLVKTAEVRSEGGAPPGVCLHKLPKKEKD